MKGACALAALLSVLFLPLLARAEKSDRDKPINIEASRVSIDDINKIQVFEGKVILTQGTMQLRADKLVVTQDADGFQKGVATGGPDGRAHFQQKRDSKEEYIEGDAEKITYDARTEKTEFFVRASIKNGQDEVRGHYISYEAITEKYLVTNSETDSRASPEETPSRVRATFQPKSKPETGTDSDSDADPLTLNPSESVAPR